MKIITKEECEKTGGHCWNYYKANDVVDEFGVINNSKGKKLVYYPNGEPQYRTCKHCKYKEKLEPAKWIKTKLEKK